MNGESAKDITSWFSSSLSPVTVLNSSCRQLNIFMGRELIAIRYGWRATALRSTNSALASEWRRGWDSNPRSHCWDACFPSMSIRPLSHLSTPIIERRHLNTQSVTGKLTAGAHRHSVDPPAASLSHSTFPHSHYSLPVHIHSIHSGTRPILLPPFCDGIARAIATQLHRCGAILFTICQTSFCTYFQ